VAPFRCNHHGVTDARMPTTRDERRAVGTVRRAVPYPVRTLVVAAARRGRISADPIWLVSSGRLPWATAWPLPVIAYLLVLLTLFNLGVRRSLRRIVAVPTDPASPELSAGRPPSG
jgi:hypothetical protein